MFRTFLSMSIFLFSFTMVSAQQEQADRKLPSVVIKDLDGRSVDIRKYAENDKITVISFWATWCVPCKKELDNLHNLLDEWEEEYNMELVAISIDNVRNSMKVRPYVNGRGWRFDVLLDENSDTQRQLGWSSVPYTVLLDREGRIVYRHIGYTEGDEYILEEKIKAIK